MINPSETIAQYFQAWNDRTLAGTTRFIEATCSPSISYVDPKYACSGVADLAARIHKSRRESPGSHVDITSAIDGYDRIYRYTWVVDIPEAKLSVPGLDVVVLDDGGRIASLTSFFGALEPVAAGSPPRMQAGWGA